MDNIFVLSPLVTNLNLKDAIDERLIKAQAITSCLLTQDHNCNEPDNSSLYGAIWVVDDYLSEIVRLLDCLSKASRIKI